MKNRSDTEAVHVYKEFYQCLVDHNCKPRLNIMDNEALAAVKRVLTQAKESYQIVEPNNHRVNTADRAIRTF